MLIDVDFPIRLKMDLLEEDERTPGINMQVSVKLVHHTEYFVYIGQLWFMCSIWDNFTNDLRNIGEIKKSVLNSMSDDFRLTIYLTKINVYLLDLTLINNNTEGVKTSLAHSQNIDTESLTQLANNFINFPKWW